MALCCRCPGLPPTPSTPRVALVLGFVPAFSKTTLEPRWWLHCSGRFLSVGPELQQTSCSSVAPLQAGHGDCKGSDVVAAGPVPLWGRGTGGHVLPSCARKATWASRKLVARAFCPAFRVLSFLLCLQSLRLPFPWAVRAPWGHRHAVVPGRV